MKLLRNFFIFLFILLIFQASGFSQDAVEAPVKAESLTIEGVQFNLWLASPFDVTANAILNPFQPDVPQYLIDSSSWGQVLKAKLKALSADWPTTIINASEISLAEIGDAQQMGFLADITYQALKAANSRGFTSVTLPILGTHAQTGMSEIDVAVALIAGFQRYMIEIPNGANAIRSVELTFTSALAFHFEGRNLGKVYRNFDVGNFYEALSAIGFSEAIEAVEGSIGDTFPDWTLARIRISTINEITALLDEFDREGKGLVREDLSKGQRLAANREIAKLIVNETFKGSGSINEAALLAGDALSNKLTPQLKYLHRLIKGRLETDLKIEFRGEFENLDWSLAKRLINLNARAEKKLSIGKDESYIMDLAELDGREKFFEEAHMDGFEDTFQRLADPLLRGEGEFRPGVRFDPVRKEAALAWRGKLAKLVDGKVRF